MAVQTEEVRDIVDFAPEGYLITSFYISVDATEFPSEQLVHTSIDSALHTAEEERKAIESSLSHDAVESIRGDLAKIEEFLKRDLDRQDTKGVAIFSCSGQDFWQVYQTPTPVQTAVHFDPHPQVAQLARFLSHTKPTVIILADMKYGRIFTMSHGEVKEWADVDQDRFVQHSSAGGWSQMRYQRRSDNFAKHHIDHIAELTLALERHIGYDWIILGIEDQYRSTVIDALHPYIRDRVIGQITVRIDADIGTILEAARAVREDAEERLINDLMDRVQEYAGAGGRGTVGLKETLQALNEQKVHILLVQDGFSQPGSICPSCGMLYAESLDACPACGEATESVDNIVDSAIQKALELGSQIEVATEFEQLKPIECIGSIMYY